MFESKAIRRIAHISDVHMLESRRPSATSYEMSLRFLSFGRALDAQGRTQKLNRALKAAKQSGAQHFVISGDLTEIGTQSQFEAFGQALDESGLPADRVTLVPGNHDAYAAPDAWKKAMEGPLRAYRSASADEPGKVVEREGVVFLPIDVACHQSIARSAGELTDAAAEAVERRIEDPALRDRAVVLVQHHPPYAHARSAWQWIDGLRGCTRLMEILRKNQHVQVLHGHLHDVVDRIIGLGKSRVFGAPAVVDDKDTPRVRLYDVQNSWLESAGMFAH
jgi:Icc protein